MSKSDEIIKSHEASKMLGMLTKGFYSDAYTALWMFEVIGREYDEMAAWSRGLRNEVFPQTCTWSIGIWEWVYGFTSDDSLTLEYRRQRLLAHIVAEAPMNPEVIRRGVATLTAEIIEVRENTAPYTFLVVIHSSEKQLNYKEIQQYIRRIKPSHLAYELMDKMPPVSAENKVHFVFSQIDIHCSVQETKGQFTPVSMNISGLSAKHSGNFTGTITIDSQWYIDGTYSLDGTRHLDAGITTEEI